MTVANVIPEIWSALLVDILQEKNDITSLFNREYEGEIQSEGDTVNIAKFDGVTVRDYPTTDMTIDPITFSTQQLLINKNKYFAVEVQDADRIQANIGLDSPILQDAAEKIQIQMNTDVLADGLVGRLTANLFDAGAGPFDLDDMSEVKRLLDVGDVPATDRWGVVPPDFLKDLLGNSNFIKANEYASAVADSNRPLLSGEIGQIFGIRIIMSNSVAKTGLTPDQHRAVFFHRSAVAFAMQKSLTIEAIRGEKRFDDIIRGFVLYGTKLVQPTALVEVTRDTL